MAKVFISYNRSNEGFVKTVVDDIESLGHTAWFDQELSGGQVWWDQILKTVRDCDIFVFLLSPAGLKSVACMRECGYAAGLKKPILPVLVNGDISPNILPPLLSEIQFVDYRKQDRDSAFRLARALTNVPAAGPMPDPLPEPPLVPLSYLGSLTEKIDTESTLGYEEQSALLVDLKRSYRDPQTKADALELIQRMRKRRDLLATIAEEFDELLATKKKQAVKPPPERPTQAPPTEQKNTAKQQPASSKGVEDHRQTEHRHQKPKRRWFVSIVLAIVGLFAGWGAAILVYQSTRRNDPAFFAWGVVSVAFVIWAFKVWKGTKARR